MNLHVSVKAEKLFAIGPLNVTNSFLTMLIVMALIILVTWGLVALISRYSSVAAITSALAAPIIAWFISGNATVTAIVLIISAILIWRHAANIRRLLAGTEGKIGGKKPPEQAG